MKQYIDTLNFILQNGKQREDRTGVGTISYFRPPTMRFDLSKGFPIITTKKMMFESITSELLWFLEGSTDERRLAELRYKKPRTELTDKKTIWTDNADKQGVDLGYENNANVKELGPVYGYNWRHWGDDQLKELVDNIKQNPYSRRHILSSWNYPEIKNMTLPPCHTLVQFYVSDDRLSSCLYQRSGDFFLGSPYNIASYALLTHIIALECNLGVGEFVYDIGDAHIYLNHLDQVNIQSKRIPHELPVLHINNTWKLFKKDIYDFDEIDKFSLKNYVFEESIKAPMAV